MWEELRPGNQALLIFQLNQDWCRVSVINIVNVFTGKMVMLIGIKLCPPFPLTAKSKIIGGDDREAER